MSRERKGIALGFIRSSVHCINMGNLFHLRHPRISILSSRRSQVSHRSCAVSASPVWTSHFPQGVSNGPEHLCFSKLVEFTMASSCQLAITRWWSGCLGTTKLTGKNLVILLQDANGKSVIPLESMPLYHLGFIACA